VSFYDIAKDADWTEMHLSISSKTEQDVDRALTTNVPTLEDFKALLSPAADLYLERMAAKSRGLTQSRFGNTLSLYIPLYLSNLCANVCTYCGFSMENKLKRKVLDVEEIERELLAIKEMRFDSILLVTGEHNAKVGMEYFRRVIPIVKKHMSYVALEIQPLDKGEYEELIGLGVDAVMVYQETYHPSIYSKHHLKGKKADYKYRIETPERLCEANIDKVGLGSLLGLEDWRVESLMVAKHLTFLEKTFWKTRYSISFPRIRPCEGGLVPKSVMTDRQLLQLICAFRIYNNQVELSLSTRESMHFRDNVFSLGVTHISAASKTQPGGYATDNQELEQFEIHDNRSAEEVASAIKGAGLAPVWRDWHTSYSGAI
jgi:2-iminoacetate synthase